MGLMIYILVFVLIMEFFLIYLVFKDILNPSVVLAIVFIIASLNLLTNVYSIGINIEVETVAVICVGVFAFFLGAMLTYNLRIKLVIRSYGNNTSRREKNIFVPKRYMVIMLGFNLLGCIYILREVYSLTIKYAYYNGSILGALSVFAEVSKFGNIGLRVGTISTLLSAILEAEAYVCGYIIVKNIIDKKKNSLLFYSCFVTSLCSTFCQGSRGGIFVIIALITLYIFLYRKRRQTKRINPRLVRRMVIILIVAILVFLFMGIVTGKQWNISFYEYISVYLGFPISNLDTAIKNGIPQAEIPGIVSFGALLKKILPLFGIEVPNYSYLSKFIYLNGHNMGNVYTIFGPLIVDFGYFGMSLLLIIIGSIMQLLYNVANKSESVISISQILYVYFLTCIAFSFFSNKICENITVFHMYELFFVVLWSRLLTKKKIY
ncbi:O-antigen polymerase [Blautia sp. HCP3S3_C4]|uniref:O-antigen polymerase n=1 Tax=Blautia sp. HCP3S3_C4 TaxID=3438911 RepID=UPI003F8B6CC2